MFSRKSKVPQRQEFCLTSEEIMEDINSVAHDECERQKLYLCIDEKLPKQDAKFTQLNDFLEGTNNLEHVVENLKELSDSLKGLSDQLLTDGRKVSKIAKNALESIK